ncbi:lipocalin family protein [Fluviicola sp.]|jgi:hypothetical protein|uniref:lipocalin family protein n=1 Tax=Fluviicola sp. TaxID=1917219 RepID=UPI0026064E52|nr:lipocalin family protein [Fluviicola sp.]
MKTAFLLLALLGIGLLPACKKEKENTPNSGMLMGTYKLTGLYYYSPGDDGEFQTVTSEKTVTFHSDGTITSNGNLCIPETDALSPSSGTYSHSNKTITVTNCDGIEYKLIGYTLIIGHGCWEQCKSRFIKI